MPLIMLIDAFAQLLPDLVLRDEKARAAAKAAVHASLAGVAGAIGDGASACAVGVLAAGEAAKDTVESAGAKAVAGGLASALSACAGKSLIEIAKVAAGAGAAAAASGGDPGAIAAGAAIASGDWIAIGEKAAGAAIGGTIAGAAGGKDAVSLGMQAGAAAGGAAGDLLVSPEILEGELEAARALDAPWFEAAPEEGPTFAEIDRAIDARRADAVTALGAEAAAAGAAFGVAAARRDERGFADALRTTRGFARAAGAASEGVDSVARQLAAASAHAAAAETIGAETRRLRRSAEAGSRVAGDRLRASEHARERAETLIELGAAGSDLLLDRK